MIKKHPPVKKRWWYGPLIDILKTFGTAAAALFLKKKAK
jgi:hypothetical protein